MPAPIAAHVPTEKNEPVPAGWLAAAGAGGAGAGEGAAEASRSGAPGWTADCPADDADADRLPAD